jgi:tetraacyldisaccharide 4'-kinase
VELAVVDAERGFGNGLPLPAGPLREPVARLAEVDAVVVNGEGDPALPAVPRFAMRFGHERFVSLASGETRSPAELAAALRGRPVAAVAGIGHPQRFFDHLAALGIRATGHAFPDHYGYQRRDLKLPGAEAILMTEKDAVKCAGIADARMWFMRIEAVLAPGFDEFLTSRLATARRSVDGPQAA